MSVMIAFALLCVLAAGIFGWAMYASSGSFRCGLADRSTPHRDSIALERFRALLSKAPNKPRVDKATLKFDALDLTVEVNSLRTQHPAAFLGFYWARAFMKVYPSVPVDCAHVIVRNPSGEIVEQTARRISW